MSQIPTALNGMEKSAQNAVSGRFLTTKEFVLFSTLFVKNLIKLRKYVSCVTLDISWTLQIFVFNLQFKLLKIYYALNGMVTYVLNAPLALTIIQLQSCAH